MNPDKQTKSTEGADGSGMTESEISQTDIDGFAQSMAENQPSNTSTPVKP